MTIRFLRTLSLEKRARLRSARRVGVATILAIGAMTTAPLRAQSEKAPASPPAFEVASLKTAAPFDTSRGVNYRDTGGPGTTTPGQWTCTNAPLGALIQKAWGVDGFHASIPSSANDLRYDIVAKIPPGATREDFLLMIQSLLIERLGMTVHHETREANVQELVVAKGGIKMKPAEPAPEGAPAGPRLTWDSDGSPHLPPGIPYVFRGGFAEGFRMAGRMQSASDIAKALMAGGIVIDKTGLTGKYDFTLKFSSPVTDQQVARMAEKNGEPPPEPSAWPPLKAALVEQLGLQLQSAKAMIDVLVVDHFNKTPVEN